MSLNAAQAEPPALLLSARAGDANAFASLVRLHQGSVYSIGLRMLQRRDLAEDLAQDVFLQLYRKLDSIESLEHLGFWLRRVTSNLAIDRLRRLPLTATLPLDVDLPCEDAPEDVFKSRELARLLGELPPAPRAVMVLRYQEDRDLSEIAALLEMPVNTVKSHIKRALTTLRSRLAGTPLMESESVEAKESS